MASSSDDDVDPRFDPRFQRGYDPTRHPEPPDAGGPVRDARNAASDDGLGSTPQREVATSAAAVDASPASEPDLDASGVRPASGPVRTRLAGVLLIVLAAALLAGAIAIVQISTAAESAGQALVGRPDRFPDILISTAPGPMAAAGCVAAVVGVALLLFAPIRRRDTADPAGDADDDVDDDDSADAPGGRGDR